MHECTMYAAIAYLYDFDGISNEAKEYEKCK